MATDASKKPRLSGVFAPTVTAFESDGSLSTTGTRAFVRFLLEQGVHGLTPLGSAGEPIALSEASPHWLAVCRESAALRGIPIGVSRAPLSPVDASVREELRALLAGLGQLCK